MNELCKKMGHKIIKYEGIEYCEKCDWGYIDSIDNDTKTPKKELSEGMKNE